MYTIHFGCYYSSSFGEPAPDCNCPECEKLREKQLRDELRKKEGK